MDWRDFSRERDRGLVQANEISQVRDVTTEFLDQTVFNVGIYSSRDFGDFYVGIWGFGVYADARDEDCMFGIYLVQYYFGG